LEKMGMQPGFKYMGPPSYNPEAATYGDHQNTVPKTSEQLKEEAEAKAKADEELAKLQAIQTEKEETWKSINLGMTAHGRDVTGVLLDVFRNIEKYCDDSFDDIFTGSNKGNMSTLIDPAWSSFMQRMRVDLVPLIQNVSKMKSQLSDDSRMVLGCVNDMPDCDLKALKEIYWSRLLPDWIYIYLALAILLGLLALYLLCTPSTRNVMQELTKEHSVETEAEDDDDDDDDDDRKKWKNKKCQSLRKWLCCCCFNGRDRGSKTKKR